MYGKSELKSILPVQLTRRTGTALVVVVVAFFILLCAMRYGRADFEALRAGRDVGLSVRLIEPLVAVFGAGIYVVTLMPLAWGVIAYFHEHTPDLVVRGCGGVVLAVATAMIAALVEGTSGGIWGGAIGTAAARVTGGLGGPLGGFGTALAWLVALSLFGVSLILATDWLFHSIRAAGRRNVVASREIATEPPSAELIDSPVAPEPRPAARQDAPTPEPVDEDVVQTTYVAAKPRRVEEIETPAGWSSSRTSSGRTVLSVPSGYRGVEFLPPSEELALPDDPPVVPQDETRVASGSAAILDDVLVVASGTEVAAGTETPAVPVAPPRPSTEPVARRTVATAADAANSAAEEDATGFVDDVFFDVELPVTGSEVVAAPPPAPPAAAVEPPAPAAAAAPSVPVYAETSESSAFDDVVIDPSSVAFLDDEWLGGEAHPTSAPEREVVAETEPVVEVPLFVDTTLLTDSEEEFQTSGAFETSPVEETPLVETTPQVAETPPIWAPEVEASDEPMLIDNPVVEAPAPQLSLFHAVAAEIDDVLAESRASAPAAAAPSAPTSNDDAAPAKVATPAPEPSAPAETEAPRGIGLAPGVDLGRLHAMELDPLFTDAMNAVLERGRASAVVLQRRLGIGYARGIRILDQMTAAGLVGPDTPTGAREIRVTPELWNTFA